METTGREYAGTTGYDDEGDEVEGDLMEPTGLEDICAGGAQGYEDDEDGDDVGVDDDDADPATGYYEDDGDGDV
eukprot:8602236-Karenia_brevis.AAC.1